MNMHTVVREGRALQTRVEGCDQGRVVSQRRNRNTKTKIVYLRQRS